MTDAELVNRILAGEERLFGHVVERYVNYVWALCASYVRNKADCEDVVQESFIQCYRCLNTLRDPRALGAWIRQVARRQCLVWLRSSSRRQRAMAKLAEQSEREAVLRDRVAEGASDREDLRRAIRLRLEDLPQIYREAMTLYYTGGYSVAEAAAFLEISNDAMKKRLEWGRKRLKDLMADEIAAALADARPDESHRTRLLAAIPFGQAAWLAKAGLPAGILGKSALIRMPVWALKAAMTVVAGGLVCAAALYGVGRNDTTQESRAGWLEKVEAQEKPPAAPSPQAPPGPQAETAVPASSGDAASASAPSAEDAVQPQPPSTAAAVAALAENLRADKMLRTLESPVSIEFEDIHISEVLSFISDSWDVNVVLDRLAVMPPNAPLPPNAPNEYVTDGVIEAVEIGDVSLTEALEYVLYPLGLDFVLEPGFVWISSPAKIHQEVVRESDERYERYAAIEDALKATVNIEFKDIHVGEILEFMADSFDVNLVLDSRVVMPPQKQLASCTAVAGTKIAAVPFGAPSPGIVFYINLKDVELRDALTVLLRPLGLVYRVGRDALWISTPERIGADDDVTAPPPCDSDDALAVLERPVSVEFEAAPLAAALARLAGLARVSLAVDAKALETPADAAVPYMQVKDFPLRYALYHVLRPFGLGYVYREGKVWVSTPERIEQGDFAAWTLADLPTDRREAGATETGGYLARVRLLQLVECMDGSCRARIDQGDGPEWQDYRVGREMGHYKIESVNPAAGVVVFVHRDTGERRQLNVGGGVSTVFAPARINEKKTDDPPQETADPAELRLLEIAVLDDGRRRARMQTSGATKWYEEGDEFEYYALLQIDEKARRVTIFSEQDQQQHVLLLPE